MAVDVAADETIARILGEDINDSAANDTEVAYTEDDAAIAAAAEDEYTEYCDDDEFAAYGEA